MKIKVVTYVIVLFALLLALFPFSPVQANGPVVTPTPPVTPLPPFPPLPPPTSIMPRPMPFPEIKYHRVEVKVEGQVALTRVEMLFVNRSSMMQEGTYLFPLPAEATISSLTMWADGQKMVGEILDKDKARQIYENIVRQRRDPALLQYVGSRAVELRVFPIPPQGERKIELEYSLVLKKESGLIKYIYPLAGTSFPGQTLKEFTLSLKINASESIRNIYSPSHEVSISRKGERSADISYEASNLSVLKDFELYYSVQDGEVGLNLLTYKTGDKGYFLLLVAPPIEISKTEVVARDVILVIDTSGSMGGIKIDQAKEALKFILNHLNADDKFNIISFSSSIDKFANSLQPISEKGKALEYVNGLKAAGSTNIHDALLAALGQLSSEKTSLVIFLTDGQPTVGVTDEKQILEAGMKAAPASTRLFTFGIGDDVNVSLLDLLAERNHGISQYVRRNDQVQPVVTSFYEKISTPVLVDLALDFGQIRVEDIYPNPIPDLYLGSQLIVAGRYRQGGETNLSLSGKSYGKKLQVNLQKVSLPSKAEDASFIPRLWATRKIGYLLDQVRLKGANREVIEEIKSLSAEFGIMTPYTSYFIQENVPMPMPMLTPSPMPFFQGAPSMPLMPAPRADGAPGREGKAGAAGSAAPQSGAPFAPSPSLSAVDQSQQAQRLKQSQGGDVALAPQVKVIADKTFVYKEGKWVDTAFKDGMPTKEIAFGSREYFQLLQTHPEWGRYFSVGDKLVVALDGIAYIITEGSTDLGTQIIKQNPVDQGQNQTQGQLNQLPTPEPGNTGVDKNSSQQDEVPSGVENTPNVFQRMWNWLTKFIRR